MPLTRHLYKEDEVAASLMVCCLRGRLHEAAFWCLEMIDSGLIDQLLMAIRRLWLFGFGAGGSAQWILEFEEAVKGDALDADTILRWTMELARLGATRRHDSSVAVLVTLTWGAAAAATQPDRVNAQEGVATAGTTPLQQFVELAAWQGKTLTAWGSLRSFAVGGEGWGAAWQLCKNVAIRKHGGALPFVEAWMDTVWQMEEIDVLPRLAACLIFTCLQTPILAAQLRSCTWKPLSADIVQHVDEWRAAVGRRRRRVYSIHDDAIPWLTDRGRQLTVYDTNEKELLRLERLTALWGSQYWDELAEEVGGWEAVRNDADARESFYDRFFPDDIPDEWSKAERAKSHGGGVLQRGAAPDPVRWFRNWFSGAPSAVVWDGVRLAMKALESAAATGVTAVGGIWKGDEDTAPDTLTWNLMPVQMRKIVAPIK
jgi:hypothetical protein